MERRAQALTVGELRRRYADIEFPEYQREPNVWSREQKQRLIDSMLRRFDIASIYLYERDDGGLECIDGRQRLNAIMSFLGDNEFSDEDNGFRVRIVNEVADIDSQRLQSLTGLSFDEMAESSNPELNQAARGFLSYEIATIFLFGSLAPEEFNLQFLRLNLGTLINAGEKLHAMVGELRDVIFEPDGLGHHPFLERVGVPTRRYAREQVAAQILLQVFSLSERDDFSRSRHFDLQRFLKTHARVDFEDPRVQSVAQTLDVLEDSAPGVGEQLRNRAIAVSVVVAAVALRVSESPEIAVQFGEFVETFLGRLRWQVSNMKRFNVDERYGHLVEFQRHLTQAAVEKPAVMFRHRLLLEEFDVWRNTGQLTGDDRFESEEGRPPPVG